MVKGGVSKMMELENKSILITGGGRLLKGIEVDILEDGGLGLPDDILKELDLRVCSVHYNRNLSREKQTEGIIRAMDNPYFSTPHGTVDQRT